MGSVVNLDGNFLHFWAGHIGWFDDCLGMVTIASEKSCATQGMRRDRALWNCFQGNILISMTVEPDVSLFWIFETPVIILDNFLLI